MTDYKYRCNSAAPEHLLAECNQLALMLGEHADDIGTFTELTHVDANGIKYAVASALVTDTFIAFTGSLPAGRQGSDTAMAIAANATLNTAGGLLMSINDDPQAAFAAMGLTEVEEQV